MIVGGREIDDHGVQVTGVLDVAVLGSDDGLRRQETKEILQRVAQALHLVDLDVLRQGVVSVDRNDTTVDGRDNCIGQVADGTSLRGGMSYGMEGEDVRCRSGDGRKTLLEYDNLQRNLSSHRC